MSGPLNRADLRAELGRRDAIKKNPFGILRAIGDLVNENDEAQVAIEMVLRALEQRVAFGPLGTILDALTRRVGLFPYMEPGNLGIRDLIAYEYHRPVGLDEDIVFHRIQAEVYRALLSNKNVILSAPTSFGKSKIIDAVIATQRFSNVAVIVPTLALIDETRRRLASFAPAYKLITHIQQSPGERNLFVLTAERAVAFANMPRIDFFVIDEFYKLGVHDDGDRMVALNEAFYRLRKGGGQFYLLGPSIESIPDGAEDTLRAQWIKTGFHTVVSEQKRVGGVGGKKAKLLRLCRELSDPTIIYCRSPKSVNQVANLLLEASVWEDASSMQEMAAWVAETVHPEWVCAKALVKGIGIHHGRLPRSLGQMIVRAFNDGDLRFLICTSTLIEGVNTRAKNVVVYDNKIALRDLDFFTFNNIQGRAGRMFKHFIGNVYVFSAPPSQDLPYVDLPLITQDARTPTSLLMQMDFQDLKPSAAERLEAVLQHSVVSTDILRQSNGIDPGAQVNLAKAIWTLPDNEALPLAWTGYPDTAQLRTVCELIWKHLVPEARRKGKPSSSKQLAFMLDQLRHNPSVRERIDCELTGDPRFVAKTVDEAVERVMGFDRVWASFEVPRYLMALSRIQSHVLGARGLPFGNYAFYCSRLESLFRAPVLGALDEYGVPPPIGEKILTALGTDEDLDLALAALRKLVVERLQLSVFECAVVTRAKEGLGAGS